MSRTCIVCNHESENPYIVGDDLAFCLGCKHHVPQLTPQGVAICGALLHWKELNWALKAMAAYATVQRDIPHVAANLYDASLYVSSVSLRVTNNPPKRLE